MRLLVLGATGRLGPHVVRALLADGQQTRTLSRAPERARTVLPAGADLVTTDITDDADTTLDRELEAADAALLLTPHGPDMAAVQNAVIDRAVKAGTRVVKVSGTSAGIGPTGPDACRQHHESEQYLADSGLAWSVIRPNGFMQTLIAAMARTTREKGIIANPLGSAGISLVDCADVGRAAAAVLTDPATDGRHWVLTGPSAPTYAEIAATIRAETGADPTLVEVTPEQAGQAARAGGATEWEAHHLAEMLAMFRTGASEYVTDDVAELTGTAPRSVTDFVRDHRDLFTG
ncbi:NAD(P)H-binding protein [Actinomycetospora sp. CA-101289]|uniref:NmrA family NAD(P)-binding protein n=1 Tax=Actinomycetospora sp. CA-101289 TaxID=3239893 RepID=UPI003D961179